MATFNTKDSGPISFAKQPAPTRGEGGGEFEALASTGTFLAKAASSLQEERQRNKRRLAKQEAEQRTRDFVEDAAAGKQLGEEAPGEVAKSQRFQQAEFDEGGFSIGPTGEVESEAPGPPAPDPQVSQALGDADSVARKIALQRAQGKSTEPALRLAAQTEFQKFQSQNPEISPDVFRQVFKDRTGIDPAGARTRVLSENIQSGIDGSGGGAASDFSDTHTINDIPISEFDEDTQRIYATKLATTDNREKAATAAIEFQRDKNQTARIEAKAKKGEATAGEVSTVVTNKGNNIVSTTMDSVADAVRETEHGGLSPETQREYKRTIKTKFQDLREQLRNRFQKVEEEGGIIPEEAKNKALSNLKDQQNRALDFINNEDLKSVLKEKSSIIKDLQSITFTNQFPMLARDLEVMGSQGTIKMYEILRDSTEEERERLFGFRPGLERMTAPIKEENLEGRIDQDVPDQYKDAVSAIVNGSKLPSKGEEGPSGKEYTQEEADSATAGAIKIESQDDGSIDKEGKGIEAIQSKLEERFGTESVLKYAARQENASAIRKNSGSRKAVQNYVNSVTNNVEKILANKIVESNWDLGFNEEDNEFILIPVFQEDVSNRMAVKPSEELQGMVDQLNRVGDIYGNVGQTVFGKSRRQFGKALNQRIQSEVENIRAQQQDQGQEGPTTALDFINQESPSIIPSEAEGGRTTRDPQTPNLGRSEEGFSVVSGEEGQEAEDVEAPNISQEQVNEGDEPGLDQRETQAPNSQEDELNVQPKDVFDPKQPLSTPSEGNEVPPEILSERSNNLLKKGVSVGMTPAKNRELNLNGPIPERPLVGGGEGRIIQQRDGEEVFVPYKDSQGNPTIGFGHKIREEEMGEFKDGITREEAEDLFLSDWHQARMDARNLLKKKKGLEGREPLTTNIITEMVFQMGTKNVSQFDKFWENFKANKFNKATKELLKSDWARKQTPERAAKIAAAFNGVAKQLRTKQELGR